MKRYLTLLLTAQLLSATMATAALAQSQNERVQVAVDPRESTDQLEEVLVMGIFDDPSRVTGSAHRIDEETLESFRYSDINRILNFVPGVYAREEDGVGLRPNIGLRGASAERSVKVMLMEDGVPLSPAPYSAPAAYFFPLSNRISGVEVFKGPASIQYGPQTVGGAINLLSAPIPTETQAMLELANGSDGYRHLHARAGSAINEYGLLGEFVHLGSDGFKSLDGGGDTGFEKNELVLKLARELGPGRLEARLSYADEVSNETYLGLTEEDLRASPNRRYRASALDRMEWEWLAARANWQQPLFGGSLQVTAYAQQLDRAWLKFNNFAGANIGDVLANPEGPFSQLFVSILNGSDTDGVSGSPDDIRIGTNDRLIEQSGIQGELRWKFGTTVSHALEVGARLHTDRIRRLHDEFGYEQQAGEIILNDLPRAINADNTGWTRALALWAQDEIELGRWLLVPGLRLEAIDNSFNNRLIPAKQENDYLVALPGFGALFSASEDLDLFLGVHRGFSPALPSLTEDLDPEESLNYELGARWRSPFGNWEATLFYNDYSNLTAVCTVSAGCAPGDLDTQTSAGEVLTQGVEFGWNAEFALNAWLQLPIALSYTYTDAEFGESFSSTNPQYGQVEEGFELPYLPPNRANLTTGFVGSNWDLKLTLTYTDRMRDQAGAGEFAADEGSDESTILDVAASYRFGENWTVTGRIDNATDEVYVVSRRPFGARPGLPRSARLMVRYSY
ncbi:MAG: TonB-dependent receptor [Pseudomonadota bacterium]